MRFICDSTLGRLARYLRMLGLDTTYASSEEDLTIYQNEADPPLLLTRKTFEIPYKPILVVLCDRLREQLTEVAPVIKPYLDRGAFMTRCIVCNTPLLDVRKEDIEGSVPEYIYHHQSHFKTCPSCKKVYWEGTHIVNMQKRLAAMGLAEDAVEGNLP